MKHTKEEIINALKVIKDECIGSDCFKCPLGNYRGECLITSNGNPEDNWKLNDTELETWRALK